MQWLENIIRTQLPDVDLSAGPPLSLDTGSVPAETVDSQPTGSAVSTNLKRRHSVGPSLARGPPQSANPHDHDEDVAEKVYALARDLGMVSLNSDSSQKYYMGSSSGLLFTNLIRASPSGIHIPSTTSSQVPVTDGWNEATAEGRSFGPGLEQRYRSLHAVLRNELPSRQEASTLLQMYTRWVHPEFPVLDLGSLEAATDALYHCSEVMSSSTERPLCTEGWPMSASKFQWNLRRVCTGAAEQRNRPPPLAVIAFILFMVFNISSIINIRRRVHGFSPERYYRAARLFAPEAFSQTSLSSVQALNMLIIHCLLTPTEASTWTLINVGMTHCVELGIHRDRQEEERSLQQLKSFIFYTMYSLDRYDIVGCYTALRTLIFARSVSSIQGRPPGLRDEAFDIILPQIPTIVEVTQPTTEAITRYARLNFELQQIASDIKASLYHLPNKPKRFSHASVPTDPFTIQHQISASLQHWRESALSEDFEACGIDAHQAKTWKVRLRLRYYRTMILLYQPSQSIKAPPDSSLQTVFDFATSSLDDYQLNHDLRTLDFGWRTIHGIFSAGATLVYSFWTSRLIQETTNATSISRSLRTCISLLAIGGEWWPSVRSSQANFGSVVDLTIERIYSRPPRVKQPRLHSGPNFIANTGSSGNANSVGAPVTTTQMTNATSQSHLHAPYQTSPFDESDPSMGDWSVRNHQEASDGLVLTASEWASMGFGGSSAAAHQTDQDIETIPVIEEFLADFGRSDFSWNVPAEDIPEELNLGHME